MKKMDIFKNQIVKTEKKRFVFNIVRESQQIETLVQDLPENEVYKMISCGGFSSIGFIKFIADRTKIKEMTVSTLRVGRKHLIVLNNLHKQGKIEKIHKLDEKHKTASIIKMMEGKHSDTEIICAALEALGDIADEDSLNEITHYLEHEDPAVRTKACCVAAKLNTDYLNTRVRYQMSQEKDPEVKKAIQEALDHAGHIVEP